MAERFHVDNASEEVFDFVCGPCSTDGDILQAKGYCSNCQDYLCEICLKHHLRPKPMRHHVLLDEKSMPKDKTATPTKLKASDTCTERCPQNPGNVIEYYCQSHDCLGCNKCFTSDNHSMCKGVVRIEDAASGLYESSEFKIYEQKIEQIGQIVNDISKSSSIQQENEETIKVYSIRAKREITSFRKSMNKFLDSLENEMDRQVSQMKESQTSKWMTTSEQIEKLDKDIRQIQNNKEQTRKSGKKCNSYINMKRNLHQLKQLEDCMVKIIEENNVAEYIFKPDASLQKVMKDTKTFGKLVTCKEDESGYLSSTPTTIPTQRNAQTQTNTQTNTSTQRDICALIDALTHQQNIWQSCKSIDTSIACCPYADAIKLVKAGRRVDFEYLPLLYKNDPIPRSLCDAYNQSHGYLSSLR